MKDHDLQRSKTNIFFFCDSEVVFFNNMKYFVKSKNHLYFCKWRVAKFEEWFLILHDYYLCIAKHSLKIVFFLCYLQEKIQTVLTMWTKLLMCPRMLRLCCKSYWIMRLIHDDGLLVWIQWVILRLKECVWTGQPGLTLPSASWYLSWHEVWLWSHNSE